MERWALAMVGPVSPLAGGLVREGAALGVSPEMWVRWDDLGGFLGLLEMRLSSGLAPTRAPETFF